MKETQERGRLTNLSALELEKFFVLLPHIFCDYRDPRRGPYELVYIFSETPDNEDSTFLKAIELVNEGATKRLGIAEGDLGHGYMGFDHSVRRLREFGLNLNDDVPISKFDVRGNVNTLSEARLLAEYGMKKMRGDMGIIAPPFHLARAFITTVSAFFNFGGCSNKLPFPVRIYAIPGIPLSWTQTVAHSQGTLVKTRAGLLGDELVRLEMYRVPAFGNMVSTRNVFDYLDWRDSYL